MLKIDPNRLKHRSKKEERIATARNLINSAVAAEKKIEALEEQLKEAEKVRNVLVGSAAHYWDIGHVSMETGFSRSTVSKFKQLYFNDQREKGREIPEIKKVNKIEELRAGLEKARQRKYTQNYE